ncbi:MAG: DUF4412 domain-containing protein [Xanthomonadales bacterium]|nr:DUF4412 domain-containing protein [Xanthomonadales bacterium]
MAIGQGKLRVDVGRRSSLLFDPAQETMIVIDHDRRRFTRLGPAEFAAMDAKMREAMAGLEQALADAPPELRAQMSELMGGALGGKPIVAMSRTGATERVAGIACAVHRIEALGRLVAETCLAPLSELPWLGAAERGVLDAVQRMQRRLLERFSEGPFARALAMSPLVEEGFPLAQTDHSGGRPARTEFAGVSRESLPAEHFAVPAGYAEERFELD